MDITWHCTQKWYHINLKPPMLSSPISRNTGYSEDLRISSTGLRERPLTWVLIEHQSCPAHLQKDPSSSHLWHVNCSSRCLCLPPHSLPVTPTNNKNLTLTLTYFHILELLFLYTPLLSSPLLSPFWKIRIEETCSQVFLEATTPKTHPPTITPSHSSYSPQIRVWNSHLEKGRKESYHAQEHTQ